MGLNYAFSQLFKGNLSDSFNGLFVPDDTIQANETVANNLQKKVAEQYSQGLIDSTESGKLAAEIGSTSYYDTPITQMAANYGLETPAEGFNEGLAEGAKN